MEFCGNMREYLRVSFVKDLDRINGVAGKGF
jgi:hypothetical protein